MSTNKNRHYVSTVEDRELAERKFGVKYTLDPISMRWVHDYPTPGGLEMAQDFLFEHSPWRLKMQEEGNKRYLLNRASCILWNEGTKYTDLRMSDLDPNTVVATLEDGTHRLIRGV